ncbi:hypothetical protein AX769_22690 (plasmid) [Frondihabitans sp. PAMC 28766]|uniref:hypothetical protein n=1 Tax=Frondihabitans sp. PAMC 28766 TaxID=1795630 RepID=UPI00078EB5C5|nr:hypothetical protein [Frondihabitans sp. PAMC 28766]AMM22938.1 hypothetical protein AX769_22690 [Frondihabitans sp. PAMC 28766]
MSSRRSGPAARRRKKWAQTAGAATIARWVDAVSALHVDVVDTTGTTGTTLRSLHLEYTEPTPLTLSDIMTDTIALLTKRAHADVTPDRFFLSRDGHTLIVNLTPTNASSTHQKQSKLKGQH